MKTFLFEVPISYILGQSNGIRAEHDAVVNNAGTINGGIDGIYAGNNATVTTIGPINGGRAGIYGGNDVNVTTTYSILGTQYGIYAGNNATVNNSGGINFYDGFGNQAGVYAGNKANVTNSGIIRGLIGIYTGNDATVTNSGSIIGNGGTAIQFGGGTNVLTLMPGFSITGNVLGTGGDKFQLGGTGAGSFNLNNLGTQYTGFTTFNKVGSATWVVTGSGTQSWTIESGTLQLGSGGTSGSITGNVTNNGIFAIKRSDAYTFGGVISGTGAFQQLGTGTTILTGANNYTGGTTISAGTLQLGPSGVLASTGTLIVNSPGTFDLNSHNQTVGDFSGSGAVTLGGATLTAGTANDTTFSGAIAGAGGLTKQGTGKLILTGSNLYTGSTTISGGTLQIGNGGTTGAISGNVTNNAVLAINRADVFILGGAISGSGAFQQNGTGTTMLTGANIYTGGTTVSTGALSVMGDISSSSLLHVNVGGTLTGTGTVGKTQINSGGTFAPGAPGAPGTSMTVSGSLAFQSGAIYLVQVNAAGATIANVTGTASLAGSVLAAFAAGSYVPRQYTILHSAGLGGTTFGALGTANLPAGFSSNLSYTGTDVLLNLTAALGGGGGLSVNQSSVANAINNFFNGGGTLKPNFLTIFGLTGGNLLNALTQLSGQAATAGQQGSFQMMSAFLGLMIDPSVEGRNDGAGGTAIGFAPEQQASLPEDIALAYASVLKAPRAPKPMPFEARWSAWGSSYGGYNKTDGDAVSGAASVAARAYGFAAGMDYRATPDTVLGFALAGGGSNWRLAQGLGGGRSDSFQIGIHGTTRSGPAYLAASLAFTNHWTTTDRFAFAGDHLNASFNAQSYGGRIETGYRVAVMPKSGVTPYAALQVQRFHTPAYSETDLTGGGFALAYNAANSTGTRSELGARFDHLTTLGNGMALTLRGRAAWAHDWMSSPSLMATFQALPGANFIVNGSTLAKDSALVSTGVELRVTRSLSLLAKFDGEFSSRSQTYAGTGTARYVW